MSEQTTTNVIPFPKRKRTNRRIADKMSADMARTASNGVPGLPDDIADSDRKHLTSLRDNCRTFSAEVATVCMYMGEAMQRHTHGTLPVLTAVSVIRWCNYLLTEDTRSSHADRDILRHAFMVFKARVGFQGP